MACVLFTMPEVPGQGTLDLSQVPVGFYMISVTGGNEQYVSQEIVLR